MGRKNFVPKDDDANLKSTSSKPTRNNKRNSRNRRPNRKDNRREMPESTNDPMWYSASPELLRDSASIPFSWPVGTSLDISKEIWCDSSPGIMAFELKTSCGCSYDQNSPINVASAAIYSFVRHANSGHSNYDAPDLMIYLLAMSSIYSYITWCQRLLGIVNMFDQRNRFTPDALLSANNVNASDLRYNIANFRFWLNNFITKAASLAVPAVMPIFQRIAFLYSNVYIDGPSIKDQMYMYVPYMGNFMKFRIDDDSKGSLRSESLISDHDATVAEITAFGDALFEAIWEQEDFGIMSGDILKAYGENIIKIAPVPMELGLVPVYDAMVLHQMKNAKLMPLSVTDLTQDNSGTLLQDVSMLVGDADTWLAQHYASRNQILSCDFDSPGPEVVIESTRLMPVFNTLDNTWSTGTEICMRVTVFTRNTHDSSYFRAANYYSYTLRYAAGANSVTTFRNLTRLMCLPYAFKYAPELVSAVVGGSGTPESPFTIDAGDSCRFWDIDNYAVLSAHDLYKMNQAALMSLFAVPSIAKIS